MVNQTHLDDFIKSRDPDDIYFEIRQILTEMPQEMDLEPMDRLYGRIRDLFEGRYPGYQASNTKYHDLEHTLLVVLATARLIHGYTIGVSADAFIAEEIFTGLAAAFFHDTGLIQEDTDMEGTGAKYTEGHEARSIKLMEKVLASNPVFEPYLTDGAHVIQCTIMTKSVSEIPFRSQSIKIIGQILGSADLLAQIADRFYLEKLILLFEEFQEARFPNFDTALDLLQKTKAFYEDSAKKRLAETLGSVSAHMVHHFKKRWSVDQDPYTASIENNILYISSLIDLCGDDFICYLKQLKRAGISPAYIPSGPA